MSGQSGGNMTNDVPVDARRLRVGQHPADASPGRRHRRRVLRRPPDVRVVRVADDPVRRTGRELTTRTRPRRATFRTSRSSPRASSATRRAPTTIRTATRVPRSGSSATCSQSFVKSPHWHNGLFVLTYDEWGGFFDHVAPPHFADDRASTNDADRLQSGRFPSADDPRVAARAASAPSITGSTTTRRSCGSSNGASSARRRAARAVRRRRGR